MGAEPFISEEEANQLVIDNRGWAESIARSVARAWSMDWESDGLGGAAMEALIFCAKRFNPSVGVPFKGYARRRIHEASTEEARRSRNFRAGIPQSSKNTEKARELSAQILDIFPNLREGSLGVDSEDGDVRSAVRGILVSATLLNARTSIAESPPDDVLDYKKMVEAASLLEVLHQVLLWRIYWDGYSLRSLATEWKTDELNVIREHKSLLAFLQKNIGVANPKKSEVPRVRPALRPIALALKHEFKFGPFKQSIMGAQSG